MTEQERINNLHNFIELHLALVEVERRANRNRCVGMYQVENESEQCSFIYNLLVCSRSTGILGKRIISFSTKENNNLTRRISQGNSVGVGIVNNERRIFLASGVVSEVIASKVSVIFDNNYVSKLKDNVEYTMFEISSDVSYVYMKRALETLRNGGKERDLVKVLFGIQAPTQKPMLRDISFFNPNLNHQQKAAVAFSMLQNEVAIIHGPPGTGKTTTTIECILQAVSQNLKVLVCAPSNVAVNNLVHHLARYRLKMIRLGHSFRISSHLHQFSLETCVIRDEGRRKLIEEMNAVAEEMNKEEDANHFLKLKKKHDKISKKLETMDISIATDMIGDCHIVFCTLTSASKKGPLKYIDDNHFDVCIIDECTQAIEAACWIPLLMVKKCILAGDHCQLPPTILCKKASDAGLKVSLMDRLLQLYGDSIKIMLTLQYRMHQVIMQYPSQSLYGNKLVAHESVRSWLLKDLKGIVCNYITRVPLLLIDTAGYDMHEIRAASKGSIGNEGEADLVCLHVRNLVESGLNPLDIAIITPYKLQASLIEIKLGDQYPDMEINSVDGFQGREKEAVVLSLVRSNDTRNVGFLAEDRRVNVAITRAKRHLTVICDKNTTSRSRILKKFFDYCEKHGEVKTVCEYQKEMCRYPIVKQNIYAEVEMMLQNTNLNPEDVCRLASGSKVPLELVRKLELMPTASPLMYPIGEIEGHLHSMLYNSEYRSRELLPPRLQNNEVQQIATPLHSTHYYNGGRCVESLPRVQENQVLQIADNPHTTPKNYGDIYKKSLPSRFQKNQSSKFADTLHSMPYNYGDEYRELFPSNIRNDQVSQITDNLHSPPYDYEDRCRELHPPMNQYDPVPHIPDNLHFAPYNYGEGYRELLSLSLQCDQLSQELRDLFKL